MSLYAGMTVNERLVIAGLIAPCFHRRRGEAGYSAVIPGWCVSTRPQMRNCASGNLEIPGSMLCIAPE
jgi:hypothetical protein